MYNNNIFVRQQVWEWLSEMFPDYLYRVCLITCFSQLLAFKIDGTSFEARFSLVINNVIFYRRPLQLGIL